MTTPLVTAAAPKAPATATDPTAKKINLLHDSIVQAGRTTIKNAIKIGELLTKQKVKASHGNWLRWVEENLSFSARTATNYVRIFERRDELKSETLSDLTAAYKLLGILAEPEQLNSKVRIQVTEKRVEFKNVHFPVTYTEVNLGFTRAKPEPEPEPEPKEAEIIGVTTPNETEPSKDEPPAPSVEGMTAQEPDGIDLPPTPSWERQRGQPVVDSESRAQRLWTDIEAELDPMPRIDQLSVASYIATSLFKKFPELRGDK